MLSSAHKKFPFLVWWQDISQWRDRENAAFSKPSQSDVWDPFLSPYCYCFPNTPKWRSSASQTSHLSGQCNHSCSHCVCYWSRRHWTLDTVVIHRYIANQNMNIKVQLFKPLSKAKVLDFDIDFRNCIDQWRSQRWKLALETLQPLHS